MKELLLAWACLNDGNMCANTYTAYYESTPTLKQTLFEMETNAKNALGEDNIKYVTPLSLFVGGRSTTIVLRRFLILTIKYQDKSQSINFTYGF